MKNYLCNNILLLLLLFFAKTALLGQRVWIENIRTTSDVGKVIVTYDLLSDATEGVVEVTGISLTFGREGGRVLTPRSISGVSLSLGRDSRIVWDCAADGYELEEYLTPRINVSYKLKQERQPYEPEMVFVQGGTFQMGSNDSDDEKPIHSVTVSSFLMGKTEVTQKQWRAVMGNNPSYFKNCDECPVEQVNWNDVQQFMSKLNSLTNKRYRLPTEAEWEYACRAGTSTPFNTGENLTTDQANYDGNYPYKNFSKGEYRQKTTPVGSFSPNAFG